MRKNEKLHSPELGNTSAHEEKHVEGVVTPASIEKMYTKRAEMLSEYISVPLYEKLNEKISGEAKELVSIIQKEKEFEEARKARKRLLDENYFTEKVLDISIFE